MLDMVAGPFWGIVLIATLAGIITIGCWVAMVWFIVHPGEKDVHHSKYNILRDDR